VSETAELAARWVERARAAGADEAEALVNESTHLSCTLRQGAVETLTEATARALHLRVFSDHRVARASSSDLREDTLASLVRGALERARLASPDECAGLPEEFPAAPNPEALRLFDPAVATLSPDEGLALARETERIGLALDSRIGNSGGASFHRGHGQVWLANSRGFAAGYRATSLSLSLYLLGASRGNEQVADFWYSATRARAELEPPETIARTTVERVRRHFGARKVETQESPVIFEPLAAAELLSDLFGAVTGEAIHLRRSFLVDALGERVAAEGVTILDDGLLPGGLGSRPFDREGVAAQRTPVFENGVLRNFLCGTYSARRLGRKSTGNGAGNGEAPSNFYLLAGPHAPEAILASVARGLYVTRLLGQGVNLVTGDYSRGAFGLWIENGRFVHPVHEITISGNLRAMLAGMEMVGSDLDFRDQFAAPTVKIARMTVAGT
jgi:PmbA protein